MNRQFGIALFVALSVLFVNDAGAACGGGGWKKPSSTKPAAESQGAATQTASTTTTAPAPAATQATSAQAAPTATQAAPASTAQTTNKNSTGSSTQPSNNFDARFDAISSQLNLDESQWEDVSKAKQNVRNRIAKLAKKLAKAEEKLAQCTGDCEGERHDVAKAKESQRTYDSKAEFEKELKSVLSSGQWSFYNNDAKVAATKKS
jgi:chromosome segregation ATPase